MGYELPAAIGAHYASGMRAIRLAGDGSIMLNLQELQTIAGNRLPIKLIVLNNNGYSSIRQTQQSYFPDNLVGCWPKSGLTFPDFGKLGLAFGFEVRRCSRHHESQNPSTTHCRVKVRNCSRSCSIPRSLFHRSFPHVSSKTVEWSRLL